MTFNETSPAAPCGASGMRPEKARASRLRCCVLCCVALLTLCACSQEEGVLQNGYYSAAATSSNSHGWKEFMTLYIYNNRIITVEYNARNASGLVQSWDVNAMRTIKKKIGSHPNEVIRRYSQELLERQSVEGIQRASRDSVVFETFTKLAEAALEQARAGDKSVAQVPLERAGKTPPGE